MSVFGDFFRKQDFGLLLIRLFLGALLTYHGITFLMQGSSLFLSLGRNVSSLGIHFLYLYFGFAACITYTVAGVFMMLGFLFRWACFATLLCFLVPFYQHWISGKLFLVTTPHVLTVTIIAFCFLFIGPGRFSVDKE